MTRGSVAPDGAATVERGIVFVVGSGRSGTHLVGHILESFPAIRITIERPPMFQWATAMALDPRRKPELLPRLVERYREEARASSPRMYADKSHPNLWLVPELAEAFPDARFIGVVRDPFATVASMLKHDGVLEWLRRWREFPVPNSFLGITGEISTTYDELSLPTRCALRWRAHRDRLDRLRPALGPERLHVVEYERLVLAPDETIGALAGFLGLPAPAEPPRIRRDGLERWRDELSAEALGDVARVVGAR